MGELGAAALLLVGFLFGLSVGYRNGWRAALRAVHAARHSGGVHFKDGGGSSASSE